MKKVAMGCGGLLVVLIGIALMLGIMAFGGYNRLNGLNQKVNVNWAQVQNNYQRRADLTDNLVRTVAGAANFEKSTLTEVTQARASVGQVKIDPNVAPSNPEQLAQFQQAQNQLGGALSRLLVVSEQYPDLKATANFRDLQAQLEGTENRIAVSRKDFNDAVGTYNTTVKSAPTVFYAGFLGFKEKPYFQAAAGSEVVPKVNFDFGTPKSTPAPAPTPAPAK